MSYRFIAAQPGHIAGICQAHRKAVLGLAGDCYTGKELAAWAACMRPETVRQALADTGKTFLVALAVGNVAGFVLFDPGNVWAMYVLPEHSRRGLGAALLALAEQAARREELAALRLTASCNAVRFYTAHGFRAAGEEFFFLEEGIALRCVRMEKSLTPEPQSVIEAP
ncbi:GNAT family N-acetyltransferase [Desulfovibrio sp. JY]|nr:GNAT family N-acetyltransferase [Desulfovibrio sp. JY]